jgi:hypothetical protein
MCVSSFSYVGVFPQSVAKCITLFPGPHRVRVTALMIIPFAPNAIQCKARTPWMPSPALHNRLEEFGMLRAPSKGSCSERRAAVRIWCDLDTCDLLITWIWLHQPRFFNRAPQTGKLVIRASKCVKE